MDTVKINATLRELSGKGGARQSRRDGNVPGILYGQDENVPLAVDRRELDGILRTVSSGNAIFDVRLKGRESEEFKAIMDGRPGFVVARWCGEDSCEAEIKTQTQATIRNLPFEQVPGGTCVRCDRPAVTDARFAKSY